MEVVAANGLVNEMHNVFEHWLDFGADFRGGEGRVAQPENAIPIVRRSSSLRVVQAFSAAGCITSRKASSSPVRERSRLIPNFGE